MNAFPEEDGLQKFREWIESPDPSILGSFNGHAKANVKKIAKVGNNDFKSSMEGVDASRQKIYQADENQQSADDIQDIKQIFIDTHVIIILGSLILSCFFFLIRVFCTSP